MTAETHDQTEELEGRVEALEDQVAAIGEWVAKRVEREQRIQRAVATTEDQS